MIKRLRVEVYVMFNSVLSHDDYEYFASYLGVDYEDYVNLELGVPDDYDEDEGVIVLNFRALV